MNTYTPWPKQALFHQSPANEILYGGAAGPGKSHALRHEGLNWCMRIPKLHVYLFRRTYPELEKNHIIPSLEEFSQDLGDYKEQKRRWQFRNVSMLHFCHCQYEQDVFNYQGAEIHLLLIDELTSFTELMYDYLRGRVRCAIDIPERYRHKIPGILCGSNPGGVGHEFVKQRWVDPDPQKEMKLLRAKKRDGGMLRQYIPGKLQDNPSLAEKDPTYINRLDALPEPYRTAYKEGDWDIFMGQALNFNIAHHVIKPIPVPEYTSFYMTFDSGFGAPFSIGWWWIDRDGRAFRFHEWYGWNGIPNQGLRLTDSEIAEGVLKKEEQLKLKDIKHIGDKWCFQKKPDYKGGGQGPSTADVFEQHGIKLHRGDDSSTESRKSKVRQFRERLRVPEKFPEERPMVQIYEGCEQFIRTIKVLQTDPLDNEDIDTTMEDHAYDEACLLFMDRPLGVTDEKALQLAQEKEKEAKVAKLDDASRAAWQEKDKLQGELEEQWEWEQEGGVY